MEKPDATAAVRKTNHLLFHPMEENKKHKAKNPSFLLVLVCVWNCSFIYPTKMYGAVTPSPDPILGSGGMAGQSKTKAFPREACILLGDTGCNKIFSDR